MRYGFSTGLSAVSDSRAIYYMDFPLLMSTIFSIVLTDWMSRGIAAAEWMAHQQQQASRSSLDSSLGIASSSTSLSFYL